MDIKKIINQVKDLFKKGAFHLLVGNFVIKFIGLFGSIFIVRLLTKEDYGMLGYVENIYSYGMILSGLGLSLASLRYGILLKSREEKKGLYLFIYKTQTGINVMLSICIVIFAVLYPHPSEYGSAVSLIVIMALAVPFQDLTSTSLTLERVEMQNRRYMYFSIISATVSVLMRVIGSALYGVEGTVIFRVLAEIIVCVILLCLTYYKYWIKSPYTKVSKSLKKEILIYSFNNMAANGIWVLFMITDVYLIGRLLNDPNALADYKVAYVIPSNMAIITASIQVFIAPYFVKNEDNLVWVKRNYFKVLQVNLILMGSLALFLYIFASPIIGLLYGEAYLNIVPLMRLLLIAFFINSGIKALNGGLLATMGHAKENLIISLIGFILQVSMASYVLPRYGITGLAINNIFVYSFMSIILTLTFLKKYKILPKIGGKKDDKSN